MILLDGLKTSTEGYRQLSQIIRHQVQDKGNRPPQLAIIQVGHNPASDVYVRNKKKQALQIGMLIQHHCFPSLTQQQLTDLVLSLNQDPLVDGVILQLPLPSGLSPQIFLELLDPSKDSDGFTPKAHDQLRLSQDFVRPATPRGIMWLLAQYHIPLAGQHAVVIGRSQIVGYPLSKMLLDQDATVTICHSKTQNLAQHTRIADIVICAVGKPNFLTGPMLKPGCVVVDVGMNRVNNQLCGDCDANTVQEVAGYYTPVPGGVGPMTVFALLANTVDLYLAHLGQKKD